MTIRKGHPPCEDVSWKVANGGKKNTSTCHPPCEDVSWKVVKTNAMLDVLVILLVRMWVEKSVICQTMKIKSSSSLWGCELKRPVGLYVISSGESSSLWGCELKRICNKTVQWKICHPPCEDVSWKDYLSEIVRYEMGHPPCEDVSWKIAMLILMIG